MRSFWQHRLTLPLASLLVASLAAPAAAEETEAETGTEAETETGTETEAVTDTEAVPSTGVPTEAAAAETAVEEVKKALDVVTEQAAAGIPKSYNLEFGDKFDWVRLKSGEWLKGNIESLREDVLEFDSDELDMQSLDFADVSEVHSPQINTYVFDDHIDVMGRAVITKDTVILETEEGIKTLPREGLLSIVEGGARERDWWSTKLRLGLTGNRGNTDQLTYNINFGVRRADKYTRTTLTYDGTFGQADGAQTVNRHLGGFEVKLFVSKRFYVVPLTGQLLYDKFQNTKFRATPTAGAGVHAIDKSKVEWDFETGVGYQYLKFLSPGVGVEDPQNDATVLLRTLASFDITGDIEFSFDWRTLLVVTTIGNTNHVGEAELSFEVTDILDIDLAFLYLRTEDPPPRSDGTVPEKNDYQLVIGIGLELG